MPPDIQILYRPERDQATIGATLTDTTPVTITALLDDPSVSGSQDNPQPLEPAALKAKSAQGPI